MLTKVMVLSVLLRMPAGYGDQDATLEERAAFLDSTATAIVQVANETDRPVRSASILLALGKNETRFARYVLEGRCQDGPPGERCDWSRRLGKPLARDAFQVHPWCTAAHAAVEGSLESAVESARCALSLMNKALRRCLKSRHPAWAGAFAVYRGQSCADGPKTGDSNYKGLRYASTLIEVERELKKALRHEAEKQQRVGEKMASETASRGNGS